LDDIAVSGKAALVPSVSGKMIIYAIFGWCTPNVRYPNGKLVEGEPYSRKI